MATLGTLILRLRADRQQLISDLQQAEDLVQEYSAKFKKATGDALSLGLDLDETKLNSAFEQIKKRQGELQELLGKPLVIKVNDDRLFDLNDHFKLKEKDYLHLQQVLNNPLVVRVEDSQLSEFHRKLRDLKEQRQVTLKAQVDGRALADFHQQLAQYTQSRTVALATSVSGASLNQLQKDLKELATGLTTARVAVQVDSQLDSLRSQLHSLPNVHVKVRVDGHEVKKLQKLLGGKEVEIGFSDRGTNKLAKSIEHAVSDGFSKGLSGNILGAVTSPLKSLMRGAVEGLGRDLFGGVSKSFSGTINQSLGNTIGSAELLGRKLAESGTRKAQNFANQLGAENPGVRNGIVQVQQLIRENLGEREVAIAANRGRGIAAKKSRADLGLAREGVLEELRVAEVDRDESQLAAVKVYRRVKPVQARIDKRDAPYQAELRAIAEAKQKALDEFASKNNKDIAALQKQAETATTPAAINAVSAGFKRVADRVFNDSHYKSQEADVQQRRAPIQRVQDVVDSQLAANQGRAQRAEDRYENVAAQAGLLQRKKQPKVVQDILDEIAPNLPEHLVPNIVPDASLGDQAYGSYSAAKNRVRLQPDIHQAIQSGGPLNETQYKTIREELEHAKDLKFGQFAGYQSRQELRLIDKPTKATPAEESAIANELEPYDPKVRAFERNAKIRRDRGYKKYQGEVIREEISEFAGLGGQGFDRSFNPAGAANDVARTSAAATRRGINLPSLKKLETKTLQIQVEHSRLMEQIGKAMAGELTPEKLETLSADLEAQVKAVVSTKQRIAGAQKGLIKTVDRQQQAAQKVSIKKNRGSFDDYTGIENIGSKAKSVVGNIAGKVVNAADQALVPHVNNLLSQVPGQPGVLDYGQEVASLGELVPQDYGKMAQLGMQGGANLLRGAASVAQRGGAFLQGAENVALSLMPGARAIKAGLQHTVLPAAAFQAATHFLPGGQIAGHALQAATHGLLGLPGAGLGAAANELIGGTLGQVPMMGGALGSATTALATGAIDMATSAGAGILAPILGGKFLLNAGKQVFNQIAPAQDTSRMLAAGEHVATKLQQPIQLPMQLKAAAEEKIETGKQLLAAAQSKLITQSIEPLEVHQMRGEETRKALPASKKQSYQIADPGFIDVEGIQTEVYGEKRSKFESAMSQGVAGGIRAGKIGEAGGIKRVREVRDSMDRGWKQFQTALEKKDRLEAQRIGQTLTNSLDLAEKEIADIAAALGSGVKSGTSKGLNQSRNKVTKIRADLQRSATKQRLNFKSVADDELYSLSSKDVQAIPFEELFANPVKEFEAPNKIGTSSRYAELNRIRNRRNVVRPTASLSQFISQANNVPVPTNSGAAETVLSPDHLQPLSSTKIQALNEPVDRHVAAGSGTAKTVLSPTLLSPTQLSTSVNGTLFTSPNYQPSGYLGTTLLPSSGRVNPQYSAVTAIQATGIKRAPAPTLVSNFDPNNPDPSWPTGFFGRAVYKEQHETSGIQPSLIERLKLRAQGLLPKNKKYKYNAQSEPESAAHEAIGFAGKNIAKFERAEQLILAKEAKNIQSASGSDGGGGDSPLQRIFRIIRAESTGAKESLMGLASVAGNVVKSFGAFAAISLAVGLIRKIGGESIEAATKLQSLTQASQAISQSRFESSRAVAASFAQSNKFGYDAASGLATDTAFKAATKDTAIEKIGTQPLDSLRQYNRVFGVSDEATKLSSTGLQQAISKGGTITKEDENQITESSPGTLGVLARSVGLTPLQYAKARSEGTISSTDLVPRFGLQLKAETDGAAETASKSAAAATGRVGNAVFGLQAAVGDKFLAPAVVGMEATSSAANLLKDNIDTLGKIFLAAILAAGSGAVSLAGGLGLASPLVGTLVKGLVLAAPALATFALQAALAYAAMETFSTIMNSFSDNSPMKDYADEMVANLARIQGATAETKQSIEDLQGQRYGKGLTVFQKAGDFINKVTDKAAGALSGREIHTENNLDSAKAKDTIQSYRLLETGQAVLATKETPQATEKRTSRIGDIDKELSLIRAENTRLTSKDRDKLDTNTKKEQNLIAERTTLESPRTSRTGLLESQLKGLREIDKNPAFNDKPELQSAARKQIAQIEAEQRSIAEQFNNAARDMMLNLQRLSSSFVLANQAIEQSAAQRRTSTQNSIAKDPLNTGAATRAAYQDTQAEQSAKAQNAQRTLQGLDNTLGTQQNQAILKRVQLDPKNFSQADFDRVSKDLSDDQGKQLLGYLTQYKEAMTQLSASNEALAGNQSGYIKAIADYNKQYGDKLIGLRSRFLSLLLSSRQQLTQIEQSVAESLIEIDKTAAGALIKGQKNKLQSAYSKFLDKLGIATDGLFDTMFESFNSILDIFGQLDNLGLDNKSAKLKERATYQNGSNRLGETQVQQAEANAAARRELSNDRQSNPTNNFGSVGGAAENAVRTPYAVISGNRATKQESDVKPHHTGKAYSQEHGDHGDEMYRSDGGKKRIVKDFVLSANGSQDVPIPASVEGIARVKSDPEGYGNYVETVDDQGQVLSRVAHARKVLVQDGERVKRGQPLAIQGTTGKKSTGVHTHWEGEESTWDAYYNSLKTGDWGAGQAGANPQTTPATSSEQTRSAEQPRRQAKPVVNPFKRTYRSQPKSARLPMHHSKPHTGDNDLDAATRAFDEVTSGNTKDGEKGGDKKTKTFTPRDSDIDAGSYRNPDGTINPLRNPDGTLDTIQNPKYAPTKTQPKPQQKTTSESPYTNVVSSFYTPGQGGAINGGNEDIKGKYIDSNSLVVATRTTDSPQGLPYGAVVEIKDPKSKKTVQVTVTDRGTLRPGRDIDLTPAAAKRLGITPDGVAGLQLRVVSVPRGSKKSSYDLGGGIGSYDKKGNYTGKSGTIVKTETLVDSDPNSLVNSNRSADFGGYTSPDHEKVIEANEKLSTQYLGELGTGVKKQNEIATTQADTTVSSNNTSGESLRLQGRQIVTQNRRKLQRDSFDQNHKEQQLVEETAAINRSRDRSQYSSIDATSQQYGGVADRSTIDPATIEAQSTVDRIVADRVDRSRGLLARINQIEADGAAWDVQRKILIDLIQINQKKGNDYQAKLIASYVADNDAVIGTSQVRQGKINALSTQYRALPSAGVLASDAVLPSVKPSLQAAQELKNQYLPKTSDDRILAEARNIIDRFSGVKSQLIGELQKINAVISVLEKEIQAKLKAAGYTPQKLDTKDPKRLALLQKVAPKETAALVADIAARDDLTKSSNSVDEDAQTAASRSVSNARTRDGIAVDRADLDYYSKTQSGNLYTQQKIDATSFQLGKRELDLDLKDGAISVELYAQKLRALKLDTDTLQNALRPLRESTNGFFDDIFKGKDVLSGAGDALRNLGLSIAKQFQQMISQHLGQQLFKSLTSGLSDVANSKDDTSTFSLANLGKSALGLLGLNDTREGVEPERPKYLPRPSDVLKPGESLQTKLVDGLTTIGQDAFQAKAPKKKEEGSIGSNIGGSLLDLGVKALGSFLGFADGGVVTSPTYALVGEGVHNEAIIPMPNGRSVPVDLKGQGNTSGGQNISSPISVTIHNSGEAKETSRADGAAISQAIKGAVMDVLINERRQGGLLA
jgi:tape measure domain-containing protein